MQWAKTKQSSKVSGAVEALTMNSLIAAVARTRDHECSIVCSHSGRSEHEKKYCWQINGFPEWWTERNQGERGRGDGSRVRGTYQNNQERGRGRFWSNAVQATTSSSSFPSFKAEQWESLTKLIEQQKPTPIPDCLNSKEQTREVILDTGASHHMTGDVSVLTQLKHIVSYPLSFAYGSQVAATQCGRLPLSKKLVLENVLFVPNLNCTLLSLAKLLKKTGCFAVFTYTLCIL